MTTFTARDTTTPDSADLRLTVSPEATEPEARAAALTLLAEPRYRHYTLGDASYDRTGWTFWAEYK